MEEEKIIQITRSPESWTYYVAGADVVIVDSYDSGSLVLLVEKNGKREVIEIKP